MKKQKLLIISIHIKNSPQAIPLAAGLLKAYLYSVPEIREKLNVDFVDLYTEMKAEHIADQVCIESPDIIGFSTYLWNRELIAETCYILKKRLPEAILFAGGPEGALPERLLSIAPFDFIIKGEGEIPIAEVMKNILEGKPYIHCRGVFVKDSTDYSENNQSHITDLNSIPSPFLTGTLNIKNYSGLLWELSRGCPFKCSFCFESRGIAGVRQYSLERIKKELELFESEKVNQIFVLDPTFNRDIPRAKTILRMIQKIAPLIHFTFEVRTEFIDLEMAQLFASINCSLQIGLQSAIPEVLSNVNRKFHPEEYAKKISLLNSEGVIFGMDLIYGLPGDTMEGFIQSINYALNLQPNHLDIFPLAVLPGTELYDMADSFRLNHLPDPPYTLISSPGYSIGDMAEAQSLENACNIFYNQGAAAGWMFMICETVNIQPGEFLGIFADYLKKNNIKNSLNRNEVTNIQILFTRELFSSKGVEEFAPVLEDIILINGALTSSLYAGPFNEENDNSFDYNSLFIRSSGTVLLKLRFSFDALMRVGELNFEEFLNEYSPEENFIAIYNSSEGVKPLIVNESFYNLLLSFDGKLSLQGILDQNPSLNKEAVFNFIKYSLAETLIHRVFTGKRNNLTLVR